MGGPIVLVNLAVVLAVVQSGSLFSADAWNNITFTAGEVKNPKRNIPLSLVLGTGFVSTVYFLASLGYMLVLPLHGDAHGTTVLARGIQYASEDRVGTAALEQMFVHSYGAWLMAGAILMFNVRVRQWAYAGGGARLLRDESGWTVLQVGGQVASPLQDAGRGVADPGGVGYVPVFVRIL